MSTKNNIYLNIFILVKVVIEIKITYRTNKSNTIKIHIILRKFFYNFFISNGLWT